jgi:ATP-dependent Zn protease
MIARMHADWIQILTSVAPFLILLALWFFLLQRMRSGNATYQKKYIDPMQAMIRSEILPEIALLRESVDKLRTQIDPRA